VAASRPSSLLTVAVPTYDGAAHLAETLQSILTQDGPEFDLVISDDRSDDQTVDLVRTVAGDRARIEINSERLGLAGNWNRCVALARTPLVAIFHQDDVMKPGHLSAHQAIFVAYDEVGLVASGSVVIDELGQAVPESIVERGGLGPMDRVYEPGQLAAAMAAGNPLRCSAATIRVAAFASIGGFDPSYRYVLDWDFWLRLSRQWRVAWLARPTVQVRWHLMSETHRFKTGTADLDETTRLQQQLFAVDLKNRPDIERLRRMANNRLGRAYLNRAHDALRAGRPELARDALRQGFRCAPGQIKTIVGDPRLAVQMATLAVAPRLAARLFGRGK
jgi:glycosyltransferase involved in cell wall biosynthesis